MSQAVLRQALEAARAGVALLLYSDDQPRDANGRWTDGTISDRGYGSWIRQDGKTWEVGFMGHDEGFALIDNQPKVSDVGGFVRVVGGVGSIGEAIGETLLVDMEGFTPEDITDAQKSRLLQMAETHFWQGNGVCLQLGKYTLNFAPIDEHEPRDSDVRKRINIIKLAWIDPKEAQARADKLNEQMLSRTSILMRALHDARTGEETLLFNPNHDERGRFAEGAMAPDTGGGSGGAPATATYRPTGRDQERMAGYGERHGLRPATSRDAALLKKLRVPPRWASVHVSDDPRAKIRAVGFDVKGRIQISYSSQFMEKNAAAKFARLKKFVAALPKIDAALARDAGRDEAAAALLLVRKTGLRPGSDGDTRAEKQAYGASTLEGRHVKVKGDVVALDFVGKKGVRITQVVNDPSAAKILRERAGRKRVFDTDAGAMRRYLASVAPGFKVKDFRTAVAAETALVSIRGMKAPETEKELKKSMLAVATTVSQRLGNTPSVALQSYIPPEVFGPWQTHVKLKSNRLSRSPISSSAASMTAALPTTRSRRQEPTMKTICEEALECARADKPLDLAWSDAAREAAAEARRRNGGGSASDEDDGEESDREDRSHLEAIRARRRNEIDRADEEARSAREARRSKPAASHRDDADGLRSALGGKVSHGEGVASAKIRPTSSVRFGPKTEPKKIEAQLQKMGYKKTSSGTWSSADKIAEVNYSSDANGREFISSIGFRPRKGGWKKSESLSCDAVLSAAVAAARADQPLDLAWSDEAREAAAEARRRKYADIDQSSQGASDEADITSSEADGTPSSHHDAIKAHARAIRARQAAIKARDDEADDSDEANQKRVEHREAIDEHLAMRQEHKNQLRSYRAKQGIGRPNISSAARRGMDQRVRDNPRGTYRSI